MGLVLCLPVPTALHLQGLALGLCLRRHLQKSSDTTLGTLLNDTVTGLAILEEAPPSLMEATEPWQVPISSLKPRMVGHNKKHLSYPSSIEVTAHSLGRGAMKTPIKNTRGCVNRTITARGRDVLRSMLLIGKIRHTNMSYLSPV